MTLVYRVEHATDRFGPYCRWDLTDDARTPERMAFTDKVNRLHGWNDDRHNPPDLDNPRGARLPWGSVRVGCLSMAALVEWFGTGLLTEARLAGYVVAVYDVALPLATVCDSQIVFDFVTAKRVQDDVRFPELTLPEWTP